MSEALSAGTVSLPVKPDTKGFGKHLSDGVKAESGGLGELGRSLGGALMAGLGAVGIAVGVGEFIKKGVEEYSAADALNAQFSAGIKSTGNAAGLTVKGMDDLAASIAGYSGQSYASIGKTEQVLQTFTNLRNVGPNKIFDDATEAAANMAAKLGGDASASAIQLGKALNDPVKGMVALRRVGVSFTQSQVDQVKAMVAAGDTMGAQKLILRELNTEFGGAAKAAGQTLPGEIARSKVAFGELTKAIVGGVMPLVTPMIAGIANVMVALTPKVEAVGEAFSKHLEPVLEHVHEAFHDVVEGFRSGTDEVGSSQSIFARFGDMVWTIFQSFKPVIASVVGVFKQLAPTFAPLIPQVLALASSFSPMGLIFHALLPVLPQLVGLIGSLAGTLGGDLAGVMATLLPIITSVARVLTGDLASIFKELMPVVASIAKVLGQVLGVVLKALMPVISMVGTFIGQLFKVIQPLIPVVMKLVMAVVPLIAPLLQMAGQILKPLIGLFAQLLTPILSLATSLISLLMPIITVLVNVLSAVLPPVIKALMPIFQGVFSYFGDVLGPIIKGITVILQGVIDFLTGVFTGNWNKVWQGIGEIFSGIWNGLIGIVTGVVNGIIDVINGVIKGVDSVGGAVGIKIGLIPHIHGLAEGGTTTSNGAVLVGEKGPELLNLPSGATVTPLNKVGGGDVHVHVTNKTGANLDDLIDLRIERNNKITQVDLSTGVQRGAI